MIELHPHAAFEPVPEIEDVPDWRRADLDHIGSTPPFVLVPKTLAEMSCDELHESAMRQVHDLEQAVEECRRVRTALGDGGLMADIAKLDAVLEYIEEHPDEWRQNTWGRRTACGTAMCVAGRTAVLDGAELQWTSTDGEQALIAANGKSIFRYAAISLRLADGQAEELFDALNSMSTLRALRDALAEDPGVTGERLYAIARNDGSRVDDEDDRWDEDGD